MTILADMGGKIYELELLYGNRKEVTPDLEPEKMKISIENTNKLLGLNLKEKDLQKLIPKMGYDYKNKTVYVPAWRLDILHEVDLIEDIAIAYGYNKFEPEITKVATIGEETRESILTKKISEILIGLGLLETSSYHLIKKEEAKKFRIERLIEVENSKVDYKLLRPNLLIPCLRILTENKDNEYPQKIFEVGRVFSHGSKEETGIKEQTNLIIALTPSNFTEAKQHLDYLMKMLSLSYELEEAKQFGLIEGRTGKISIDKKEVGYMGEFHPQTLHDWGLKMPLAVIELNLDEVFEELK